MVCGNVWYLGPTQNKATPPGSRHEEEGSEQDCTRQVGKGGGLSRPEGVPDVLCLAPHCKFDIHSPRVFVENSRLTWTVPS